MTDEQEELKAQKRYEKQVKKFRAALSSGKTSIARDLVEEYDWPTDMLADELSDWFWA